MKIDKKIVHNYLTKMYMDFDECVDNGDDDDDDEPNGMW